MNKKVMALAVAGALAAPAAALAQVQIGGSIHLQYFSNNADNDSASTNSDNLRTSEPEIYVRGEEKLGDGNSIWFQCTSSFDVLGQAASSTTGAGQWCGRNSAIGYKGGFGNLFFGTWDTPHKLVSNSARGWWGGTNTLQGGTLTILANDSESNAGNTGISFFRRQRNSISYHSPDFSGFSVNAMVSASNESTARPDSSGLKPRLYSLGVQYKTGPFFAGVGYEMHNDFNPAGLALAAYSGETDTSINVAVGYTFFNALKVSGLYMQNTYNDGAVAGNTEVKDGGLALYVDWTLGGPHSIYAQYAQRDKTSVAGTDIPDTKVTVMGLAYGYRMSKRSQVYVAYNQMKNDNNISFDQGTAATTVGGKQTVIGVGLRHSF